MGTMWRHLDVSLKEEALHLYQSPFAFMHVNYFYHLYFEYLCLCILQLSFFLGINHLICNLYKNSTKFGNTVLRMPAPLKQHEPNSFKIY